MRSTGGTWAVLGVLVIGLGGCSPTAKVDPGAEPLKEQENCSNTQDDDGDGKTDCADPDCFAHESCVTPVEDCTNGVDDNMDQQADCEDPTCRLHPLCAKELCAGGLDEDGDGQFDCEDSDCANTPECLAQTERGKCNDGLDNDSDGLTDCQDDTDCADAPCGAGCACGDGKRQERACSDGMDNDGDSLTDCADPDCVGAGTESCADGVDNTCDRLVDCADPQCADADGGCQDLSDGVACSNDGQCAGGKCLTEAATGSPNGACSNAVSCNPSAQTGCRGGICVESGAFDVCRAKCTGTGLGTSGKCRQGYACLDTDTNTANTNSMCIPLCGSDEDCGGQGADYGCNLWSRRCEKKDKKLGKYGAACSSGAQCESGLCTSNYPGGYCLGLCTGSDKSCAADGVCYFYPAFGDNVGECYEGCVNSGQCRSTPFTCADRGQGNICVCGRYNEPCSFNSQCCSGVCDPFYRLCN